jgi:cold-inducible RNA-binding protein
MGTRLFVGNLPYKASEDDLKAEFAKFGSVKDCHIVMDRDSGQSKGFGFIEMASQDEATKAIAGMNDVEFAGRKLNVSEARPRADKPNGEQGGGKRW